jgi:hypothetical protein
MTPQVKSVAELLAAVAIAGAFSVWSQAIQQPASFLQIDASHYYEMARNFASGERPTAEAPFVYRIGMPWLVSKGWPGNPPLGFRNLNLISSLALAPLLTVWFRVGIQRMGIRLLMVALFAAAWHGPVRYMYYNAGYVDPLFMVFTLVGLILCQTISVSSLSLVGFTLVSFAGALVREVAIILPISALWALPNQARNFPAQWLPTCWSALLPIGASAAAVYYTHRIALVTGSRSYLGAVAQWIRKPITSYLVAWFTAFGPALSILIFDFRAVYTDLRNHRLWLVFLLSCAVLAFIGGSDTERFVFWSMPIVYMLLGRAVERCFSILRSPGIAATLILAQCVSARVFWAIPDTSTSPLALTTSADSASRLYGVLNRLVVVDDFHMNLWSSFGSRPFQLLRLALYFTLTTLLVLAMRRREQRIRAR